jgi:hypothetical protein
MCLVFFGSGDQLIWAKNKNAAAGKQKEEGCGLSVNRFS